MDSGNSGSLQSSNGGDDEFDSRGGGGGVDSSPLSALLRPAPSSSASAFSLHGSFYGLQDFASAGPSQQQPPQAGRWSGASASFTGAAGASSSSSPRVSGADQGARQQGETSAAAQGSAPQQPPAPPPRGSRKRTRASRRAPTTVLTTDTSNFRAMVQEFTGIPSPPFAAVVGSPATALRTRFDHIFRPPSSLRSAAGDAASLPPYLLRPFPQKLPSAPSSAFPAFTSSSSSSSTLSSSIGIGNANAAPTEGASSNPTAQAAAAGGHTDAFQQLTSSALLRLQDPSSYLTFQNLLESQSSSQSIFGAGGGFAQAQRLQEQPGPSSSEFLASIGSGNLGLTHGGLMGGAEGLHLHPRSDVGQHGGDELSGVVASGGSCKPSYSSHAGAATSSSAAASGDRPPDAGASGTARPARGEGLDPWICTSE